MYPPQAGSDGQGNIYVPFTSTQADIPFAHWMRTTRKVWESNREVVIESVIITNRGELFIQYVEKVNDTNEYPKDGAIIEMDVRSAYPESLVNKEEKRSYE